MDIFIDDWVHFIPLISRYIPLYKWEEVHEVASVGSAFWILLQYSYSYNKSERLQLINGLTWR